MRILLIPAEFYKEICVQCFVKDGCPMRCPVLMLKVMPYRNKLFRLLD